MKAEELIPVKHRNYLPEQFTITWESIQPFIKELKERPINSRQELEKWLRDMSELDSVLSEDSAWRYIRMTCDTTSKELQDAYNFYVMEIEPKLAPEYNELNKKLVESKFLNELDQVTYMNMIRNAKKSIEIFREENIPIHTQIETEKQQYMTITGAMTIEQDGKEITLQQAALYLKNKDRKIREEVYRKTQERRLQDRKKLDDLYNKLIGLRDKVAHNAGFENYRDYKFKELGRFDYTKEDCFKFHDAVSKHIVPLVEQLVRERKQKLGFDKLRPWDLEVNPDGKEAQKVFANGSDLLEKTIKALYSLRPYFGLCLEAMKKMKHLDLESRKGKAPGGYNYPLYESGVPFIFMNAAGTLRDLVTMVHEGGHAVHSFLTNDLQLTEFKSSPSEVAELASMSMELLSMNEWKFFFDDPSELAKAKREQLEKIIRGLPWIARIDKFQHWIYENPKHTTAERDQYWNTLSKEFSSKEIDYSGLEEYVTTTWHSQLHLFELPFYYIEYGFAQLGAIAVWRNFMKDQEKALDQYEAALKLGYTRSIKEIYETAGVSFDFSEKYVSELAKFLDEQLGVLKK
jgi:oligoendopeptidase F